MGRESNKDLGITPISQPLMIQEPNNTLMEDEKVEMPDQLPSPPQGLLFYISQLSAAFAVNVGNHVVINQILSGLATEFPFQRVVPLAIDRSVEQVVTGVVRKSVRIACQTTKELVLLDYASEPDEKRIYRAAYLMVASLAGSLAHVECKEPLRTSISRHLRSALHVLNIKSDEALEEIVQLLTNDNLDLGCAVIEQAATEKAVQTIGKDIAEQLLLRRKPRDGAGPSLSQNSVSFIPECNKKYI